jgi:hypothetical protein
MGKYRGIYQYLDEGFKNIKIRTEIIESTNIFYLLIKNSISILNAFENLFKSLIWGVVVRFDAPNIGVSSRFIG